MKILHTGDWHIGKQLYREELRSDHECYFDFLEKAIIENTVDVLLVSGDVFDYANPTNESKKMYLDVLGRLKKIGNIKIIVTAGNHDSITFLESSKEILNLLDISVIGNPENIELIPIGKGDDIEAIVIPIPYVADRFLRKSMEMADESDRIEASRKALLSMFENHSIKSENQYPGILKIAMGHLYVQGANVSDSERKIQIGNLASVSVSSLDPLFDYLALGHIHKPQSLSHKVRYAGSPIALSFSERNDEKQMILLEIINKTINIEKLAVPTFRTLKRISGSLEQVQAALTEFKNPYDLPAFLELEVIEDSYDPSKIAILKDLEALHQTNTIKVLSTKILFTKSESVSHAFGSAGMGISELDPVEVFSQRIQSDAIDNANKDLLKLAFLEILEEVQSNQSYENQ